MRRATISFLHEKTKFRKPHIRLDYQLSPITVKTSVVQSSPLRPLQGEEGASLWVVRCGLCHRVSSPEIYCCSVTQSCPTLCDPVDCSAPGLPVPHHLLEFAQTHVRWVTDAVPPSHALWFPSPPFSLSQHQGHFQWVGSSRQVTKALEPWVYLRVSHWVERLRWRPLMGFWRKRTLGCGQCPYCHQLNSRESHVFD